MSFAKNWITVVLFLASFLSTNAPFAPAAQPPAKSQTQPPAQELAVNATLSTAAPYVGSNLRFWLTIRNLTSHSLPRLRLRQLQGSGYHITYLSWCPIESEGDSKAPQEKFPPSGEVPGISLPPKCSLIADSLKPGQSITLWGDLRVQEKHSEQTLVAVLSWGDAKKIESWLSVPLGEVRAVERWVESLSYAINLIKDLALPILLGFLAYFYQRLEKARDRARSAEESAREQIRQEQDRLRTQLAETWSKMLPESHRLATRFYMPAEAALQGVLQFLQSKDPGWQDRTFFYLALFERRMRHLLVSAGGFYFKDRVGEKLAIQCYQKYRSLYYYSDNEKLKRMGTMLNHIFINESWASFQNKLNENGPAKQDLENGWNDFKDWLRSGMDRQALLYLKAFRAILSYEMNRPYEYWYGLRETIELDAETEKTISDTAQEIENEEGTAGFAGKAGEYLAKAKGVN